MSAVVGRRNAERQAANSNNMSQFETELVTRKHKLKGSALINTQCVDGAMAHTSHGRALLDRANSDGPVYGAQEKGPPTEPMAASAIFLSWGSTGSKTVRR